MNGSQQCRTEDVKSSQGHGDIIDYLEKGRAMIDAYRAFVCFDNGIVKNVELRIPIRTLKVSELAKFNEKPLPNLILYFTLKSCFFSSVITNV